MRILFDMCIYDMRNKGNVALLQVAITRIREYWPDADLGVISISPYILELYCPTAHPIRQDGQDWRSTDSLKDQAFRSLPRPLRRFMFEMREAAWYCSPSLRSSLRMKGERRGAVAMEGHLEAPVSENAKLADRRHEGGIYRSLLKDVDSTCPTLASRMHCKC
jgi:hypothetical protein